VEVSAVAVSEAVTVSVIAVGIGRFVRIERGSNGFPASHGQ
jgi:hypothetical protein